MVTEELQPSDSNFPAPADEYTDDEDDCESSDDDWDLEDVEEQPHPSHIWSKYANW